MAEEFKEEGAQSGYAEALHWCPHVKRNVAPIDLAQHEGFDPRFCLSCQVVFCGRFAQKHMLEHYESSGHCVAAGLGDLSFWCYQCESYLYHRTIPALYTAYTVLHSLKFSEAPVDYPLPSAEPVGEADGDEDEEDAHMETSRTAAARQLPERSSSQLEPLSQESQEDGSGSQQLSQNEEDQAPAAAGAASAASASAAAAAAPAASSSAVPIAGLSASQLSHPLVDRMLGVIYGNCLGDAVGLATEFLNRKQVNYLYGDAYDPSTGVGAIDFPHTKKTAHSKRWEDGDWTDDSDQMILILETILETFAGDKRLAVDRTPNVQTFAAKLYKWVHEGFPELGDDGGMGLGALTSQVVRNKLFLTDPHAAAKDAWEWSQRKNAANGGLMRTSITGVFDFHSPARVLANTAAMCGVTHADPRCLASCVLVTTLISSILRGADISTPAATEALIQQSLSSTLASVPLGEHEPEFRRFVAMKTLAEMELDDCHSIGFTLKCMSSGLFGLRSQESFEVTMTRLAREGGDADTNGAVCGALIGARIGYAGLPAAWLRALPHKAWLDAKVVPFIQLVQQRLEQTASKQEAAAVQTKPAAAAAAAAVAGKH